MSHFENISIISPPTVDDDNPLLEVYVQPKQDTLDMVSTFLLRKEISLSRIENFNDELEAHIA